MSNFKSKIPEEVIDIVKTFKSAGFEVYLVGGCIRELLRGETPKDWDLTTNAKPHNIIGLFDNTFYENDYGTVGVVVEKWKEKQEKTEESVTREMGGLEEGEVIRETSPIVEVTPYRLEAKYTNHRQPDSVTFSNSLEDDLKRRDFTMNAIAYDPIEDKLIDPYQGQKDIKDKIIKAVGSPEERLNEDALRILRAIRLATVLGFSIDKDTEEAIKKTASKLEKISMERIRDEFVKIIMSDHPKSGILLAHKLGVFKYIIPELEEGITIDQNQAHSFDVWTHNLKTLEHGASKNWTLKVRIAALLHDVSKPETRRWSEEKKDWTFYGHDVVGGRVARKILTRLKFPNKLIDDASLLVRYHLFFSDTEKITPSAVRRIVRNVGKENIWDLMKVRACDRIGTGRPKEQPYRLRKYKSMIEEVMRDPISVGALKIKGERIMEITQEKPGPRLGWILHALLEEVLDDPQRNTEGYLENKTKEFSKLSDKELKEVGEKGKERKEKIEETEVGKIRKKYWVK